MKKHIFKLIGLPAIACSFVYLGCYIKANEFHNYGSSQVITIDTVLHTYY
jgi:hypothetical protein